MNEEIIKSGEHKHSVAGDHPSSTPPHQLHPHPHAQGIARYLPKPDTPFSFYATQLTALALARTLCAPFERVQYVLQTDADLVKSQRLTQRFAHPLQCARHLVKEEGVRGLWRGNNTAIYLTLASPLLAHTLTTRAIGPLLERSGYNLRNTQLVITGAVATTVFALLYPLDLARTRLACDVTGVKERQFSGAVDVWRKVLQTDGIKGLYRGFGFHMAGVFCSYAIGLTSLLVPHKQILSLANYKDALFVLTPIGLSAIVAYGLDTGARRAMVSSGEEWKYRNSKDAFVRILRADGAFAFFRGASVALLSYMLIRIM